LNACLTVRAHEPNSHANHGWEQFTDEIIRVVNNQRSNVVFMLWGGYAQKKGSIINESKHCVIQSAHPSPLSATKWFGCKVFSKANDYFKTKNLPPINWNSINNPTTSIQNFTSKSFNDTS